MDLMVEQGKAFLVMKPEAEKVHMVKLMEPQAGALMVIHLIALVYTVLPVAVVALPAILVAVSIVAVLIKAPIKS